MLHFTSKLFHTIFVKENFIPKKMLLFSSVSKSDTIILQLKKVLHIKMMKYFAKTKFLCYNAVFFNKLFQFKFVVFFI